MSSTNLPTLSIVTPSFNQGRFIDETLRSVLGQGYPGLEYVVVDGGSTDDSVEIIRRHEDELAWWVSEPDGGHYAALNKGFGRTSGEIMGWLNSDDVYLPHALDVVGGVFAAFPEVEWITTLFPVTCTAEGAALGTGSLGGFNRSSFLRGANLPGLGWHARGFIQQESTFWRRSLWERAGGRIEDSLRLAGDFELWARFYESAELVGVSALMAAFRYHDEQKTASQLEEYLREATAVLGRYHRRPPGALDSWLRRRLWHALGGVDAGSPLPLEPLLRPFSYGATNCVWRNGRWELAETRVL